MKDRKRIRIAAFALAHAKHHLARVEGTDLKEALAKIESLIDTFCKMDRLMAAKENPSEEGRA